MKKMFTFFAAFALCCSSSLMAQDPITATSVATYNAAFNPALPDSEIKKLPYATDLGVRRVIVADANNDGKQEIIATDYSNGGRVHVLRPSDSDGNKLEVIWSSPVYTGSGSSTPRYPQVGDVDGDGNPEIIFEQYSQSRIVLFEWINNTELWGTEPAFEITNSMFQTACNTTGSLRFTRECLTVRDFDGDGKSEIIPHTLSPIANSVYILGVNGDIPGFADLAVEGGHSDVVKANSQSFSGGSYWNSVFADIDADGKKEIVNHHWDYHSFWSIDPAGPDSYIYPDTSKGNYYAKYGTGDAVCYFGATDCDVNGDGQSEIATTMYGQDFDLGLLSFTKADTGVQIWNNDPAAKATRFGIIAKKSDLAALAGKTAAEFWTTAKGDLNKDGKDEIYTGGGRGLNLLAIQYKGTGSLLDPANYTSNIVYNGEGGDVYATYNIYNCTIDTVISGNDTSYVPNYAKPDTIRMETPFTSFIYADNVDLNQNGKLEIVLSEQSVYDSTTVKHYEWVDSTRSFDLAPEKTQKIYNSYRKTIRVLEAGKTGFTSRDYEIISPEDYVLEQNYPNPFNPSTSIRFVLPIDKKISLKVYDMLGREVATLINDQVMRKGTYTNNWNGKNNLGAKVVSGNYIARLTYGTYAKSIKMTLLK